MKKKLTDRQFWQIWINEYNRWTRAGFNHAAAVLRADALVAAKRAQMQEENSASDA